MREDHESSPFRAVLAGDADGACFDGPGFGEPVAAAAPVELITGGPDNWDAIERGVRSLPPGGRLAGWFDYNGAFTFGLFPQWQPFVFSAPRVATLRPVPVFAPRMTRSGWVERVRRVREYIAAGDIYQVNLTHALVAEWPGEAGWFHPFLRHASPAPYSCFLRLGGTTVMSSSPECFLHIAGRSILTRPIKGTRPRTAGEGDAAAVHELTHSEKERAELVMITDLERNDLGQVCEYGSVRVSDLCRLESFAQVHHLVSTVEGTLRPGVSAVEAVRACYPGGSITGAPKKRAREIIAELEPAPRGIYTGALGWFGADGTAVFNIAIRTLVVSAGVATFGVGAGIVADSEPEAEYDETLHKAGGLRAALAAAGG